MLSRSLRFPKAAFLVVMLFAGRGPIAAQDINSYITSQTGTINGMITSYGGAKAPVIVGAQLYLANGAIIGGVETQTLLNYVDGLKAAGVQRVDFNPGVTLLSNPATEAKYDAVVRHIRQLGLRLAINPVVTNIQELGPGATFQDFQNRAMQSFPQIAARYQPDNLVIVHEPTSMEQRMGLAGQTTVQQWHNFIVAVAPLIKAASPRTRLGAGDFFGARPEGLDSDRENMFYQDFVTIPNLDFMTMDIYNDDAPSLAQFVLWAQLAHQNNKAVYIEENARPAFLPNPLPTNWQDEANETLAVEGSGYAPFAPLDALWLKAMVLFASLNEMEAMTYFQTNTFFLYVNSGPTSATDAAYIEELMTAVDQAHEVTSTGQAFLANKQQMGIKEAVSISSASYQLVRNNFNGSFADSTVAADELVSAFGAGLATSTAVTKSTTFPTNLAGTTVTLLDSSNKTHDVPLLSVSPGQINYLVPETVNPGPATLTVTSADGTVSTGIVLIAPVAPGLYTANANGQGAAAAIAVTGHADGSQSTQLTFTCSGGAGSCVAQPISLGASTDTVVLELYGTGLRHRSSQSNVTVQIKGQNQKVLYAAAQPTFSGLDQINVQISRSLAGSGEVNVVVTVEDVVNNITVTSNTATINIQ